MADGNPNFDGIGSKVPLRHIDEHRRSLGAGRLSYQLEIRLSESWTGLAAFARACASAGLDLRTLRCGPDGRGICTLSESDATDLAEFDRAVGADDSVVIVRWTTVIDF